MNVGIFVILLGAVLLQQVFQISANHCDYNEDETPCKYCTENCCDGQQNVKKCPKPCLDLYKNGKSHTCQCKKNLYRTVDGKCVAKNACPKPQKPCPKNQVFKQCGTACEPSCNLPEPQNCTKNCIPKVCQCKPGFFRNGYGGPCIPEGQCPKGECPYEVLDWSCWVNSCHGKTYWSPCANIDKTAAEAGCSLKTYDGFQSCTQGQVKYKCCL